MKKIKLSDKQLSNIKRIELNILEEIDRICRKNNIKYSVFWGTLIGQIRHGGFIPWDDDIDIVMPIEDYDKFIECIKKDLNTNLYYFANYHDFKDYGLPFGKMMAKNTIMKEISIKNNNAPNGIFVDIIPIYPTSNNIEEINEQCNTAKKIYKKLLCKANYTYTDNIFKLFLYRVKKIFYIFESKNKLINDWEKNARKYVEKDFSNYAAFCMTSTIEKGIFKKELFDKYIDAKFEHLNVMMIENGDAALRNSYGDYMQLPPIEEQVSHHFVCEIEYENFNK